MFELALEKKQAEAVQVEFAKLAEIIQSTDSFELFLQSPAISLDAKKETLAKALTGRVSDLFMDFLMVVADKDRLDVHMPDGVGGAPVLVYFHGGALMVGDKSLGDIVATRLLPLGIGVVSANYRLSPGVQHPTHSLT